MKIRYLIVLFFVGLSFAAAGQENYFYINWDVNVPLSNTEWISNTSARMFIGRERRFSAGIDFNWGQFDEYKPKETFETEQAPLPPIISIMCVSMLQQLAASTTFHWVKRNAFFPMWDWV